MKGRRKIFNLVSCFGCLILLVVALPWGLPSSADEGAQQKNPAYTGSSSCRECHEKFYKLWAPSHHGLAMQPYSDELARNELLPQREDVVIGGIRYRADIQAGAGYVVEKGPDGEKKYPISYALGGKNVYYFLTPLERGRLQTLPVAYDVRQKQWYDTAASGMRHFPNIPERPVGWKEWYYTFNTGCHSCHVSQYSLNYDKSTDTYRTTWKEPGINCETCHGPAEEHIEVCKKAPKGTIPKDLKITRGGRSFTHDQNNATCSSCHAKASPITSSFQPGDGFYDHFDLVTLESADYYPDGRDLGENYTYTTWIMSPCVKAGHLDCLHCHTSSGRFRQKDDPNQACMPCHKERVENSTPHTHHPMDSNGNLCISCHMPMTEFARMQRTDHSMLPPTPAATLAYSSPNACTICHQKEGAAWADKLVRQWHQQDFQAPVLERAALIDAARRGEWARLPAMLAYITKPNRDEATATSLIRLMRGCEDKQKWPTILNALQDPSPLVRSAAADHLQQLRSNEAIHALVEATGDESRLVRVRAAGSIVGFDWTSLSEKEQQQVKKATDEYLASMLSRPDQWTSNYNLGNYYLDLGEFKPAEEAYERALKFDPTQVMPLVNLSITYARAGENTKAEESLSKALSMEPKSLPAQFNMGLLKAEKKDYGAAEFHLREALKADPSMAEAAYNLGVLLANKDPKQGIAYCRRAFELRPQNAKYGCTLAYYEYQAGNNDAAVEILKDLITNEPSFGDGYVLLGDIYEKDGKKEEAEKVYQQVSDNQTLSTQLRSYFRAKLEELRSTK